MAQSDLSKINALYVEGSALHNAVNNLNGGGKIVAMTIGPPPYSGPPEDRPRIMDAMIATIGWDYPQSMTDAIRNQLQSRLAEINSELAGMGVGGFS